MNKLMLKFSATFINCYTEDDVPVIGISDDPCEPEHFLIISQFIDGDDSIDESIGLQTHLSEQEFSGVIDSVALSRQQLHITIREEKAAAVGMRTIIADLRVSVEQWDILAGYIRMIFTGSSIKITLGN